MGIGYIVGRVLYFYQLCIIVYVLLSWFPMEGFIRELRDVLANFCEPYLGLFRRIIPPIGMIDISPIIAIIVLQLVGSQLVRFLP